MTFMAVLGTLKYPQFYLKTLWLRDRFGYNVPGTWGKILGKAPPVRLCSLNLWPQIAGFSSNQDSIHGTDWCLYKPSGQPKCSGTQIPSRSEAIRILLGPYFGKFHDFPPFFVHFLQKNSPWGPLILLKNWGDLVHIIKKICFSFQALNATCDAVTHTQPNRNPEKPRFPTAQIWEFGRQI